MDVDRVVELARKAVLLSTPFISAWEMGEEVDGEELHEALREALGITYDEWWESDDRG